MLFDWVGNQGLTLRQVVRRLQEQGIRPRRSERGVWNTSTLSTLLRNSVYIGEAHWGSSHAVVPKHPLKTDTYRKIKKSSRDLTPKEEWIFIPVPAIIERELFERTRAQLATNYALCIETRRMRICSPEESGACAGAPGAGKVRSRAGTSITDAPTESCDTHCHPNAGNADLTRGLPTNWCGSGWFSS